MPRYSPKQKSASVPVKINNHHPTQAVPPDTLNLRAALASPKISPKKKRWVWLLVGVGLAIFLATACAGGYVVYQRYFQKGQEEKPPLSQADFKNTIGSLVQIKGAQAQNFAGFKLGEVKVTPSLELYQIEEDLTNIVNRDQFYLSEPAKELLAQNAFVVVPGYNKEFFELYEKNRYEFLPSFITVDSVLHNFHLLFDYSLKKLEEEKLIPALKELNVGMLTASELQYQALQGTPWEKAALRNIAFFTVATHLLEPAAPIGAEVKEAVEKELDLIEKQGGIDFSPVLNIGEETGDVPVPPALSEAGLELNKEDYSQYIPRGHYTKSEDLKRYFKTMMWYGRLTFRLKDEDETRSAILATLALGQKEANFTNWEKIYEPTNFFVGKSDDITFYQYLEILERIYGENINLEALLSEDNFRIFLAQAKALEPPELNSMPIFDASLQPDREEEIKGFRFMGQRFTIDASIFQRLVYREVKENSKGQRRMLPKGLDIPAALGSEEAYDILKGYKEDDYQNYPENMQKMRDYLAGLNLEIWTQNLYWGWLYSLNPLLTVRGEGYPAFAQTQAWLRKNLNSYLGSWTELKHDTILYAKQVYAEMGGGGPVQADDRGYVEPEPEVYVRLSALARMMQEGLELRGILSDSQKESIGKLEEIAGKLQEISEKELEGKTLSEEDYNFIRFYGGELEHLWLSVMKDEGVESASQAAEHPAALVADVATDPNGAALEEAIGNIFPIYVVFPLEDKLKIGRGGVFSYYEFTRPLAGRLTDEEWWAILEGTGDERLPDLPDWTQMFIRGEE